MSEPNSENSNPDFKTTPTNNNDGSNDKTSAGDSNSNNDIEKNATTNLEDTANDSQSNVRRPPPPTAASSTTRSLPPPPQPHELTAEWTVRAQLRFARAGERVQREFSSSDPVNPVRVAYKWSNFDAENTPKSTTNNAEADDDDEDDTSCNTFSNHKRNSSFRQSMPLKAMQSVRKLRQSTAPRHESFRSTTSSTIADADADADADLGGCDSAFSSSNTSNNKKAPHKQKSTHDDDDDDGAPGVSQRTTSGGGALYGTRCRSTCNIVVSAVADFLPVEEATATAGGGDFVPEEDNDAKAFVYHTTTPCYTMLPEKSLDDIATKNLTSFGKILALRDAFSQTSDTETKYFEEKRRYSSQSPIDRSQRSQPNQPLQQQHRKPYEQRRSTAEAVLQPARKSATAPAVDEADSFMPSLTPSASPSLPRIPPIPDQQQTVTMVGQKPPTAATTEPQKKPRTVHIDVYCTGSDDDDEDQADGEASSSADEGDAGSACHDRDSNSTPQTVLDNEQMLLRHQRVTGQALPRRMGQQQQQKRQQQKPSTQAKASSKGAFQSDLNLGHAITKSSTAEEVSESKQLLFRKHIGDQRAAKLQNLRQKYMRQPSDDILSSNYPNSSRSTVRDATCSSISSAVPSSPADYGDSSWKETEEQDDNHSHSLAKSDSFEYENAVDRLRIKQMERFWASHGGPGASSPDEPMDHSPPTHTQSPILQPIAEGDPARRGPQVQRNDSLRSESENYSETDVFCDYTRNKASQQRRCLQQTPRFMRNRPGFLQFFGPPTPSPEPIPPPQTVITKTDQPMSAPVLPTATHLLFPEYGQQMQRWKSETRENLSDTAPSPSRLSSQRSSPQLDYQSYSTSATPQRCASEAPSSSSAMPSVLQSAPTGSRLFDIKAQREREQSPLVSEASSSLLLGYTSEYLEKARKFGNVVRTVRKPGHHVGPTKNPNCSCDSCQRWLTERFQLRGRAFSLNERPVLKRPT